MQRRIDAWKPKPANQDANVVTVTDRDWKYEDSGDETGSLPVLHRKVIAAGSMHPKINPPPRLVI
jgi:hypothetical protein